MSNNVFVNRGVRTLSRQFHAFLRRNGKTETTAGDYLTIAARFLVEVVHTVEQSAGMTKKQRAQLRDNLLTQLYDNLAIELPPAKE